MIVNQQECYKWFVELITERLGLEFFSRVSNDFISLSYVGSPLFEVRFKKQKHISLKLLEQNINDAVKLIDNFKVNQNSCHLVVDSKNRVDINLDLPLMVMLILGRYEEIGSTARDEHNRFLSRGSLTHRTETLNRPIVDECFEFIGQIIQGFCPNVTTKQHRPKMFVTCDVDYPYEAYLKSWITLLRKLGSDLFKRHDVLEAHRATLNYYKSLKQNYIHDLNHTFDWMMDINEKAGNQVTFNFLAPNSSHRNDGCYSIDEPRIRELMRHIAGRGHNIGLHGSYLSYKNKTLIKKEADKLRDAMNEEGIKQEELGSRQHYLRWSTPETASYLDEAKLTYDSTLGYADHAGFRCGTCHEYRMYDLSKSKTLNIRQKPLILMEASILNKKYMGMDYTDQTLDYMKQLKATCYKHGGNFTLLWHNSHLTTESDKRFYEALVNCQN